MANKEKRGGDENTKISISKERKEILTLNKKPRKLTSHFNRKSKRTF